MKKFGNVVVHCRTKKECDTFLELMKEEGYNIARLNQAWGKYEEETCFRFANEEKDNLIFYSYRNFYRYLFNYNNLTFEDFYTKYYDIDKVTNTNVNTDVREDVVKFLEALGVHLLEYQKEIARASLKLKDK